jgi:hypothetical protein
MLSIFANILPPHASTAQSCPAFLARSQLDAFGSRSNIILFPRGSFKRHCLIPTPDRQYDDPEFGSLD